MTKTLVLLLILQTFPCLALDDRAVGLAEKALPAVVTIEAEKASGLSKGTGFLVDASGTVVTCLHVISSATKAAVVLPNSERYEVVRIRAYDERRDLAILRISGFDLPTISLGNSNTAKPGQSVLLLGSNLGLPGSVTSGVISAVRNLPEGVKVIQTDAPANRGNSGGPLINDSGEAIGVLGSKMVGAGVEGVAFALPINYVRGLLEMPDENLELNALRLGAAPRTELQSGGDHRSDRLANVQSVFVDTFGTTEAAIEVRERTINRISTETPLRLVENPSEADASLTGFVSADGNGWADNAIVRLIGKNGAVLWAEEAGHGLWRPGAGKRMAGEIVEKLGKALKASRAPNQSESRRE